MRDPGQFESVFAAHAASLVLYARQWLSRAAAEDAVQDAFARLLAMHRWPDNVQAWLFQVVRNLAIDQARAVARRGNREMRVARARQDWFEPHLEDRIDAKLAERALESLAPEQREVVVMRIWGQMTLAAIAEVTGEAVSTIFSRYRAALNALGKVMNTESSCWRDTFKKTTVSSRD